MFAFEHLDLLEKKQKDESSRFKVPLPVSKDAQAVQKLLQLKQKRNKLLKAKADLDKQILQVEKKLSKAENEHNTEEYQQEKTELLKLEDLIDCYRLTGLSVQSEEKDAVILCFDNSYGGKFLEPYHIEFQRQGDDFHLKRHNVPSFVPVDSLAEKYLSKDVGDFLAAVGDYLFAFVSRREEMVQTQEIMKKGNIANITTSTEAVDYIEMRIGDDNSAIKIDICLTYKDLLQDKPSKVSISTLSGRDEEDLPEDFNEQTIHKWKTQLQIKMLSEAMGPILETLNFITLGMNEVSCNS